MSAKVPISSPMVSPSPPFNVHLDLADVEFLQKLGNCQERQKNTLFEDGKSNTCQTRYGNAGIPAPRQGKAHRKPLRTELQADRDKGLSAGTRKLIIPKSLEMHSPTPSAGSRTITTALSTAPSTTSLDVVVSWPVPTPRVQSRQALLTGSTEVLSFQLDATKDYPFGYEVRSTSTLSVVTAASPTAAASTERTQGSEAYKEAIEPKIEMEAKETKRRGRRRKQQENLGELLMRKNCLGDALMKVIRKLKAMEKPIRALKMDRGNVPAKAKVVATARLQNRIQGELAARRANLVVRLRWVTNPQ